MPRPLAPLLCLAILLPVGGLARTWDVPTDAPTIAAALDSAATGDVVQLACGTYLEHDLALEPGVTVRSASGLPDCATVDAQSLGRVFLAQQAGSPSVLSGLTITGGLAGATNERGGAILCQGASLNLINCVVTGNQADYDGGAIYAHTASMLIYNSELSANTSVNGAGGAVSGHLLEGEFFNSSFVANTAVDGAGVRLSRSSPLINWCSFVNNEGQFFGGGLFLVTESDPDIIHCTVAGNTAYLGAGLMLADNSAPTIEMCIVAFNGIGAGIEVHDSGSLLNNFRCNDLHGNEGGPFSGHADDLIGIDGNIDDDPLFCDLDGGDVELALGSPCLPPNNDCTALIGAQLQGCVLTPMSELPPAAVGLEQNRPNPFNPRTTIAFRVARPGPADLRIHDLAGRLVAVLHHGDLAAGRHEVTWDGLDDRGRAVASGTYVYRLVVGDRVVSRRMSLLK